MTNDGERIDKLKARNAKLKKDLAFAKDRAARLRDDKNAWYSKHDAAEAKVAAVLLLLDDIERLAFDMPAPNKFTPQFVMMVIHARAALTPTSTKEKTDE